MAIDILLLSAGLLCLLLGVLGAFIPILPGPPFSYAGLLLIHFTGFASISSTILYTLGILTVLITVADYLLPIWGTRMGKGSRHGAFGAAIGLVAGILFFPPLGVLFGPLAGAWLAEKANGKTNRQAARSALGSFVGLILGVTLKFTLAAASIWYALSGMIINST
ncbi:MAG: DUF456 domain-containing protein [Bacteroidetes bacterium]|nr:MAG: DUF456 domain-containing protein [Bacteroidota bacterium]